MSSPVGLRIPLMILCAALWSPFCQLHHSHIPSVLVFWFLSGPPRASHSQTTPCGIVDSLLLRETTLARSSRYSSLLPSSFKRNSKVIACSVLTDPSPMLQMKQVDPLVSTPKYRCRLFIAIDCDPLMTVGWAKSTGFSASPSGPFRS